MASRAYPVKWLHCGEFRRFTLNVGQEPGVYDNLVAKCRQVNGDFSGQLAWMDKDEDLIVFNSDVELTEALDTIDPPMDTFRIFTVVRNDRGKVVKAPCKDEQVKVEQKAQPAAGKNDEKKAELVHPGVVCDGCEGQVVGIRYKCMVCPDYDLCAKCDANKVHKEHNMARIVDPNDVAIRRLLRRGIGGRMGGMGRMGPWGAGSGRCPMMRQNGPNGAQAGPNANVPKPPGPHGFPHGPAFIPGEEMLKQVGKSVAAALSSLGIDVDIDVEDTNGKRDRVQTDEDKPKADAPKTEKKPEEPKTETKPEEPKAEAKPVEPKKDVAEPEKPAEPKQEDWTMVEGAGEGAVGGQPVPSVYPTAPLGEIMNHQQMEDSLQYLLAMGFTNDGGWLKQLVAAKQGDVNAVLDALNPRRS